MNHWVCFSLKAAFYSLLTVCLLDNGCVIRNSNFMTEMRLFNTSLHINSNTKNWWPPLNNSSGASSFNFSLSFSKRPYCFCNNLLIIMLNDVISGILWSTSYIVVMFSGRSPPALSVTTKISWKRLSRFNASVIALVWHSWILISESPGVSKKLFQHVLFI